MAFLLLHKLGIPLLQRIFSIYYQYPSNILTHLPRIISSWKSQHNSMVSNTISLWIYFYLIPRYFSLSIISLSHSFEITNQCFLLHSLKGNCWYQWILLVSLVFQYRVRLINFIQVPISIQTIDIINYSYSGIVNQFLSTMV